MQVYEGRGNSSQSEGNAFIVDPDDPILVTGAAGFIGFKLVENLLNRGFHNVRCFARPSSDVARLNALAAQHGGVGTCRSGHRQSPVTGGLHRCDQGCGAHLSLGRRPG